MNDYKRYDPDQDPENYRFVNYQGSGGHYERKLSKSEEDWVTVGKLALWGLWIATAIGVLFYV